LARTNFKFAKRQKELERKKKMEEKRQRKLEKKAAPSEAPPGELQPAADEDDPTAAADLAEVR
jgi:hypothetical protein